VSSGDDSESSWYYSRARRRGGQPSPSPLLDSSRRPSFSIRDTTAGVEISNGGDSRLKNTNQYQKDILLSKTSRHMLNNNKESMASSRQLEREREANERAALAAASAKNKSGKLDRSLLRLLLAAWSTIREEPELAELTGKIENYTTRLNLHGIGDATLV
ncbi:unnamed protein product, partial [Amoebophrya sp. A25]